MKRRLWIMGALLLALGGCSGDEEPLATSEKPVQDHLFKAQAMAMEKAKGVEQMLQDAADAKRREIEEKTY